MARPFSRATLAHAGPRCEKEFVFFYGHTEKVGEKAVFSNWYVLEQPFKDEHGHEFPTSEHYMMYTKAKLFGDDMISAQILSCASAREAKKLGRMVNGFDAQTWDEHCISLVTTGCEMKFSQCQRCRDVLLRTGNKILAEAAPRDRIWGIGMGASNPLRLNPGEWRGQNRLGEVLMVVRERLRNAERKRGAEQGQNAERGSSSGSKCMCCSKRAKC